MFALNLLKSIGLLSVTGALALLAGCDGLEFVHGTAWSKARASLWYTRQDRGKIV